MTPPEVALWQALRGKPGGVKFRRQHPIGPYIVDFYCRHANLVIEVDGEIHGDAAHIHRDAVRGRFMADNGYRLLRCRGADILKDPARVAQSILALAARPLHHPADGPPPRAGEDCGVIS